MLERLYEYEEQKFDCIIINQVSFYKVSYEVCEGTGLIINDNSREREQSIAELDIADIKQLVVQSKDEVTVVV